MSLELIELWHKRARPEPDAAQFNVQLGCHLEEIVEMLRALQLNGDGAEATYWATVQTLEAMADMLKQGVLAATVTNRKEFLDALADQIVTAVGTGHCAGMNVPDAARRVDGSNWSKFVDGYPVFDENGKIAKGPDYRPVDLTGLY